MESSFSINTSYCVVFSHPTLSNVTRMIFAQLRSVLRPFIEIVNNVALLWAIQYSDCCAYITIGNHVEAYELRPTNAICMLQTNLRLRKTKHIVHGVRGNKRPHWAPTQGVSSIVRPQLPPAPRCVTKSVTYVRS